MRFRVPLGTVSPWHVPPRYPTGAQPELTGVVLDSDVIIEILRGARGTLQAAIALEESGVPTFCTAISWAEIFAGVRRGEEAVTRAFFEARGEVVLDGKIGRQAGDYLARYAKSHGVEIADALIAAAAISASAISTPWDLA